MNKLLSCHYNMDTNRVEARFADGTIAAMPVGRKTTASAKRRDTLATDNFCHLPDFMLLFEELDKDCQVPHPRLLL